MTLNKVLLGQSYFLHFDPKLWEAMQPHPPLGSLYAASYLRSRGYPVALFDAMLAASEEEWVEALTATSPASRSCSRTISIIYLRCVSSVCGGQPSACSVLPEARLHRDCLRRGCSDHSAEYLAHGADFILLGEGEITLGELLDSLSGRSQQPLEAIQSLAFYSKKDEPGSLLQTPRRPEIKDLDPCPSRPGTW